MAGINTATMAALFRVDQSTIRAWARGGMPIVEVANPSDTEGHKYDLQDCVRWFFRENYERLAGERMENRLKAAKLAEVEARTAVENGKLIPPELMEEILGDVFSNFKANMLALPTKVISGLQGRSIAEQKEALASELAKICDALAEGFDFRKTKVHQPVPEGGEVGEAATENIGEPVVGPISETV